MRALKLAMAFSFLLGVSPVFGGDGMRECALNFKSKAPHASKSKVGSLVSQKNKRKRTATAKSGKK